MRVNFASQNQRVRNLLINRNENPELHKRCRLQKPICDGQANRRCGAVRQGFLVSPNGFSPLVKRRSAKVLLLSFFRGFPQICARPNPFGCILYNKVRLKKPVITICSETMRATKKHPQLTTASAYRSLIRTKGSVKR